MTDDDNAFICGLCQQRFDEPELLEAHLRVSHQKRNIEVPEEEGTHHVVLTWASGITTSLWVGPDPVDQRPWTLARYGNEIGNFLARYYYERDTDTYMVTHRHEDQLIGFPNAQRPEWLIWFTRHSMAEKLQHIHETISLSPSAARKMGGRTIEVPAMPGLVPHGPGRRGRN